MQPIFLIGYMGSGKSTMGRLVSRATGLDFIDLDLYIENRFHRSIRQIFDERGEEGFRQLERSMLHEVADMEDVLVACGGGTACFFDNMEHINSHGESVWLEAPVSVLLSRLLRGQHKRPLLAGLSPAELETFIKEGLQKREPFYSKARHRFCTALLETDSDREQTAQRFINKFCPQWKK